jgi:hypothetical protein
MWDVLRKGTVVQKRNTALRVDVADAMKRLWARDERRRTPSVRALMPLQIERTGHQGPFEPKQHRQYVLSAL